MPWKETSVLEQRMKFVLVFEEKETPMAELCRQFGISRPTGYKWVGRYIAEGIEGLRECSRAPHRHPNAVSEAGVERIIALRREHPTWGPKKLRAWLMAHEAGASWPAASTVGAILKDAGLSHARRRSRKAVAYTQPFAACEGPNAVWCADFKGWFRTRDGKRCEPLTISDGYSRFLLRCQGLYRTTLAVVTPLFEATFREYGLPWAIRTDNGPPFGAPSVVGLSSLAVWWVKLGIKPERIAPGKPQENGRHERLHLTLKREATIPPLENLRRQQRRFEAFRQEYNYERPHEALGQTPPAQHYTPSPRPYPDRLPVVEYDSDMHVRKVYHQGCIYWRGRLIFISETLANEYVALKPTPIERYYALHFTHLTVAYIDTKTMNVLSRLPKHVRERIKNNGQV